jgi:hypothetical protein
VENVVLSTHHSYIGNYLSSPSTVLLLQHKLRVEAGHRLPVVMYCVVHSTTLCSQRPPSLFQIKDLSIITVIGEAIRSLVSTESWTNKLADTHSHKNCGLFYFSLVRSYAAMFFLKGF